MLRGGLVDSPPCCSIFINFYLLRAVAQFVGCHGVMEHPIEVVGVLPTKGMVLDVTEAFSYYTKRRGVPLAHWGGVSASGRVDSTCQYMLARRDIVCNARDVQST